jgi:hypothetical protein
VGTAINALLVVDVALVAVVAVVRVTVSVTGHATATAALPAEVRI